MTACIRASGTGRWPPANCPRGTRSCSARSAPWPGWPRACSSREPLLTATVAAYLGLSFLYSWKLKHVPVLELLFVASGFLLRVLGGAAATHVPPSGWFLAVCSLGALGVVLAKRYTELTNLGAEAIEHRPVMRWYRPAALRLASSRSAPA